MVDFIQKIPSEAEDHNAEVTVYKIRAYPADYTLKGLHDKQNDGEIVNPAFQRGYVWTIVQASRLIESFLLGLPVPAVFFNREAKSQKLLVIDGRQRLETVFSYFDNKWPESDRQFPLQGVDPKWLGKSFDELDTPDRIALKDSVLRAIIVEQVNPLDNTSIYHIFERLNTGGTALTPQEIRNCVYHGVFNELLNDLNRTPEWRDVLGRRSKDRRMRDVEFILRFLALTHDRENYKKPMKRFLSAFMSKYRQRDDDMKRFREIFTETVRAVHGHLGGNCFRIKAGLNVAVLDSVMVTFACHLDVIPLDIPSRYSRLLENPEFLECVSVSTTDEEKVTRRLLLAQEILFR